MRLLNNPYVRQALITAAAVAILSRIKGMNASIEKIFTGGSLNPAGNQNNTSTVA
jgi:hypothetical protein